MTSHDQTPPDISELAAQLEQFGVEERRAAEDACARVTMRTARLLTDPAPTDQPESVGEKFRRLWLWLAAPTVAAAAVLVAVLVMSPSAPTTPVGNGVEVLAATIESDIDAWLELDAMWQGDSFETNLAALCIDAAGITTQSDSLDPLPSLESDL